MNFEKTKRELRIYGGKKCSCGDVHETLPVGTKIFNSDDTMAGYWFECQCGSTLFVKFSQVYSDETESWQGEAS